MATEQDALFGKLAIRLGHCTERQVQEAIRAQASAPVPRPLGAILVELGHLTREQASEVVDVQVEHLDLPPEQARERKEDIVFGKLVVKQGLLPRRAVARALRAQIRMENEGRLVRLGQILLAEGALSRGQIAEVLEFQRTHVLTCTHCLAQFNLVGFQEGKRFKCRQCETVLTVPARPYELVEDPPEATAARAPRARPSPPARKAPPATRPPPVEAPPPAAAPAPVEASAPAVEASAPADGAPEVPSGGDAFADAARLALQPSREPLLLGEIALARGYITRPQLDAALDAQEQDEANGGAASLGEVLLAQGALDRGRLEDLVRLQDEAFRGTDPVSRRPREDVLFAQLAVQKGLVSQPEMNRVLRTQGLLAEQGRRVPLGQILVEQGLLSTHLVQNLLAFQRKRILRCPACGAQFTVHRYRTGNRYRCARCPGELEVPSRLGSLEVEGVIDGG